MCSQAEKFDRLVREVFAPCYPVIAGQIMEKTGITRGLCLDLGAGNGYLGLALGEISGMEVCLLDNDPEMLALCRQNAESRGLGTRVRIQSGDVHHLPLPEASVQLVVSRGSVFFWDDHIQAFKEIRRVLAPGGMACIGGGFGSPEIKAQIDREMLRRDPEWPEHLRSRIGPGSPDKYPPLLKAAGIDDFEIDHSPEGLWIIFGRKD